MNDYKIILDKERTLKYSNRSFIELEKLTGRPIVSVFTEASQEATAALQQKKIMEVFSSVQFLTSFVYCGLLHEKELTYDEIVDFIPSGKYMEIMTLALEVLPAEFGMSAKAGSVGKKKAKV